MKNFIDQEGVKMGEIKKLKILLNHWIEHNDEHANIYRDWAKRAMVLGNEEVSKIFELLHYETEKLNRLIEKAIEKLDKPNKLSRSESK